MRRCVFLSEVMLTKKSMSGTNNHNNIWLTATIAAEKKKLGECPHLTESARTKVAARLDLLPNRKCTICNLPGHTSGHCWLNSQMYEETLHDEDAAVAWHIAKKSAGIIKKRKQRDAVEVLQKAVEDKIVENHGLKYAAKRAKQ